MKKPDEIVKDFERNCGNFLATSHQWRKESAFMYQIRDNRPIVQPGSNLQAFHLDKPELRPDGGKSTASGQSLRNRVLNVVGVGPALVNACVGLMTQYRQTFVPHNVDPAFRGETDLMGDGIEWGVKESNFDPVLTDVVSDTFIRGVGAMDISLDPHNSRYPVGAPLCEHKHHIFFDRSKQQATTSENMGWCGYGDPIYGDQLEDYMKDMKVLAVANVSFREQFLEYTQPEDEQYIEFLYHYYWYEYEKVRVTENLFVTQRERIVEVAESEPMVYELFSDFANKNQIDVERSQRMNLGPDAWKEYETLVDNVEYMTGFRMPDPDVQETRQRIFYRARFADNKLILASQSYSKTSHPLKLFTGYYDRTDGVYYGPMRAVAYMQELLNDASGDLSTYAHRSATGGTLAINGLGTELGEFVSEIKNNEQVILTPADAQARSLGTADAGQTMLALANWAVEMMPLTLGVDKAILGQMNSDTPAASLYRDAQKQMRVSLSHIMDKLDVFLANCGDSFADMVTMLIDNHEELRIPKFNATADEKTYQFLSNENIARNYVMSLESQSLTDDEQHAEFIKLMEMAQHFTPEQKAQTLPVLLKASSLDDEVKDELTESLQPGEQAQQQMQVQQQIMMDNAKADIRMKHAQASQLENTARREQAGFEEDLAQAELDRKKALVEIDKAAAEIDHKQAQTGKAEADTAKVVADIGLAAFDRVSNRNQVEAGA